MNKPALLPTYATDATLSSGPQTGLSTRLDPGTALRQQGYYQDRRLPARALGWLLGTVGDWLGYFSKAQVKNWRLEAWDFFTSSTSFANLAWIPESENGAGSWWAFSFDSVPVLHEGRLPNISTTGALSPWANAPPAFTTWNELVGNAAGTVLVAQGFVAGPGNVTKASTDLGGTWSAAVVNGRICYCKSSNLFLSLTGASAIQSSPDGMTWTNQGSIGGFGAGSRIVSAPETPNIAAIDNAGRVAFSTDGGLSWGASVASPSAGTFDAAYTTQYGWCFISSSGSTAVTTDGSAFTAASPFAAGKAGSIASDGVSRYCVAHNDPSASPGPGVYFSDDGASTWELVRFRSSASPDYCPVKIQYNGHSQWAVLGAPAYGGTNKYAVWLSLKL